MAAQAAEALLDWLVDTPELSGEDFNAARQEVPAAARRPYPRCPCPPAARAPAPVPQPLVALFAAAQHCTCSNMCLRTPPLCERV